VLREVEHIDHATTCLKILKYFKDGGTHLAIVTKVEKVDGRDPYLKKIGLVTLEDIIEEIIDDEIEDEFEDNNKEMQKM
jgi:metal transporter CNNM